MSLEFKIGVYNYQNQYFFTKNMASYTDSGKVDGVFRAVKRSFSDVKGVNDFLGVIARTGKLLKEIDLGLDADTLETTARVADLCSAVRSGLIIPHAYTVLYNWTENPLDLRANLDLGSSSCNFCATLTNNAKLAKKAGGMAGAIKLVTDVLDLYKAVNSSYKLTDAKFELFASDSEGSAGEMQEIETDEKRAVKEGISSLHTATMFKVAKIILSIFAGSVASVAFFTGVIVPDWLSVCAVVASLVSVVLSFASTIILESASYQEAPKAFRPRASDVPPTPPVVEMAAASS
jgi:hypothetical protein